MKCKNCNINEAVKYSKYAKGEFCSKICAASFSTKEKRIEINKAVSKKMKGHNKNIPKAKINCLFCCKDVFVRLSRSGQKFCSKSCSKKHYMSQGNIASELGKKSVTKQKETRRSKNEIYFGDLCINKFNTVLFNEPMFNGWDADVIIPELKIAVLWNGKWHYEKITDKHSVEQVQNRDRIKLLEIEKTGYKSYTIKDMGKWNKLFVEKEFKKFLAFL